MKKVFILIILTLVLGLGAWLWIRQQPTHQINQTVDELFDQVAHRKISVRNPSDTKEAILEILAKEVTLAGIPNLPDQALSREDIIDKILTFHQLTTSCEFAEESRTLQIEGERAQVYRTTNVAFAYGPDTRTRQSWDLTFDLEKQDRWRITSIRASPPSGN